MNVDNNNQKGFEDNEIFIVKEPIKFRNEIQELMKQNAGIIREETKPAKWIEKNFGIRKRSFIPKIIL